MKFKYYLRGAGIGIILTTIIFMIAIPINGGLMNDEAAVNRAKELGYVEAESADASNGMAKASGSLTVGEYLENSSSGDTATANSNDNDKAESSDAASYAGNTTGTDDGSEKDLSSSGDDTAADTSNDTTIFKYTFTINSSENSADVARRLEKAGIVDDASDFDQYLVKNSYDTKLSPGTYSLQRGMTYSEIVDILFD